MNIQTLLNLKRNPHYKFSPEQQAQLDEYERNKKKSEEGHMVEFGAPPFHNQTVPTHEKGLQKRKRTKK